MEIMVVIVLQVASPFFSSPQLDNSVPMASSETSELFNRLLGNPQDNVTKAISSFVQEFEVLLNSIANQALCLLQTRR